MRPIQDISENKKVKLGEVSDKYLSGTVKLRGPDGSHLYYFVFTVEDGYEDGIIREHASVSRVTGDKLPTWEEMCDLKDIFWEDEEECIQIHPRKSDYVNLVGNCLHIWSMKRPKRAPVA